MPSQELDLQIGKLRFVVEREPHAAWGLRHSVNPDWYVLGYAKSGTAHYTFGEKSWTVRPGNVVLIRRGEQYSARSDPEDPWSFFSVGFSLIPADEASESALLGLPNVFTSSNSSRMAENFAELHRLWLQKDPGHLIKCRSLIMDIFYLLLGDEARRARTSAHYEKIARIIGMMQQQYDRTWSVDALARMCGLSTSHFRALFKEITGLGVTQFQNRLKIDRAKDLIVSHTCNVTEAAEAVGFCDVFYFSRMFRKLTGKNPSEYL